MYRTVSKSLLLTASALLLTLPASAQVRVDLGPVHIRIANEAPPRPQVERRMARPDRDSVWIAGYWDRQDSRWAWVAGRWERPSDRAERWVNPKYTREGNAWRYEPAHWSTQKLDEGEDYQQWKREHGSDRKSRKN